MFRRAVSFPPETRNHRLFEHSSPLKASAISLPADGFAQTMSGQEFADLLGFLNNGKGHDVSGLLEMPYSSGFFRSKESDEAMSRKSNPITRDEVVQTMAQSMGGVFVLVPKRTASVSRCGLMVDMVASTASKQITRDAKWRARCNFRW